MQSPTFPSPPPPSISPLICPSSPKTQAPYPTVPLITILPPQQISSVSGPSPILGSPLGMARTASPMHTHSHSHSHTTVVVPVHYYHYGHGSNNNYIENAGNRQKTHITFNSTPINTKAQQQAIKTPSFSNIPIHNINLKQTSPLAFPTESKPQSSTTAHQKNENTQQISQNRVKRAKSYEIQTIPSFIQSSSFHPRPHPHLHVPDISPSLNQQRILNKNIPNQKIESIQNCNIIPISPLYVVRCCDFCAQNGGYANDVERIERERNWQRERKFREGMQILKEQKFTDKQFRQNGLDGVREKIGCEDQALWKNMASTNEEQFKINNKRKQQNKNNEKSPKKPKPQKSYLTETDQKPQKCQCCKYCQYPSKSQTKTGLLSKLSKYSPYFPNSSNSVFSPYYPSPSPCPYSYMTQVTPFQNQPSFASPIKSKYANPNRIQKQVKNRIKYSNSKYTKTSTNANMNMNMNINNQYANKRKSRSKENIENKKRQKHFDDQNYQYQLRREKKNIESNGYGYSSNIDDINAVIQDLKQQNRLLKLATQYT